MAEKLNHSQRPAYLPRNWRLMTAVGATSVGLACSVVQPAVAEWFNAPKTNPPAKAAATTSKPAAGENGFVATIRRLMADAQRCADKGDYAKAVQLAERAAKISEATNQLLGPSTECSPEETSRFAAEMRARQEAFVRGRNEAATRNQVVQSAAPPAQQVPPVGNAGASRQAPGVAYVTPPSSTPTQSTPAQRAQSAAPPAQRVPAASSSQNSSVARRAPSAGAANQARPRSAASSDAVADQLLAQSRLAAQQGNLEEAIRLSERAMELSAPPSTMFGPAPGSQTSVAAAQLLADLYKQQRDAELRSNANAEALAEIQRQQQLAEQQLNEARQALAELQRQQSAPQPPATGATDDWADLEHQPGVTESQPIVAVQQPSLPEAQPTDAEQQPTSQVEVPAHVVMTPGHAIILHSSEQAHQGPGSDPFDGAQQGANGDPVLPADPAMAAAQPDGWQEDLPPAPAPGVNQQDRAVQCLPARDANPNPEWGAESQAVAGAASTPQQAPGDDHREADAKPNTAPDDGIPEFPISGSPLTVSPGDSAAAKDPAPVASKSADTFDQSPPRSSSPATEVSAADTADVKRPPIRLRGMIIPVTDPDVASTESSNSIESEAPKRLDEARPDDTSPIGTSAGRPPLRLRKQAPPAIDPEIASMDAADRGLHDRAPTDDIHNNDVFTHDDVPAPSRTTPAAVEPGAAPSAVSAAERPPVRLRQRVRTATQVTTETDSAVRQAGDWQSVPIESSGARPPAAAKADAQTPADPAQDESATSAVPEQRFPVQRVLQLRRRLQTAASLNPGEAWTFDAASSRKPAPESAPADVRPMDDAPTTPAQSKSAESGRLIKASAQPQEFTSAAVSGDSDSQWRTEEPAARTKAAVAASQPTGVKLRKRAMTQVADDGDIERRNSTPVPKKPAARPQQVAVGHSEVVTWRSAENSTASSKPAFDSSKSKSTGAQQPSNRSSDAWDQPDPKRSNGSDQPSTPPGVAQAAFETTGERKPDTLRSTGYSGSQARDTWYGDDATHGFKAAPAPPKDDAIESDEEPLSSDADNVVRKSSFTLIDQIAVYFHLPIRTTVTLIATAGIALMGLGLIVFRVALKARHRS